MNFDFSLQKQCIFLVKCEYHLHTNSEKKYVTFEFTCVYPGSQFLDSQTAKGKHENFQILGFVKKYVDICLFNIVITSLLLFIKSTNSNNKKYDVMTNRLTENLETRWKELRSSLACQC
jgi:hypothetical protein